MAGPLVGIRVLELGRFRAGAFSGILLADLGAEVIRVERPGGGEDRHMCLLAPSGDGYGFASMNRNKKAISLNFEKNDKGKGILKELVKRSDIVTHNFAPKAAQAVGVTYEDIRAIKPDVIFAQISAFGLSGPYSHRVGFDPQVRATAGVMSISGFPGMPTREQVAWVDYLTATLNTVGILAALQYRQKTGQGQMVDAALLQTAITCMAPFIAEWETGGKLREQVGNQAYWEGPTNLYKTKDDRWVFLSIITNPIWKRFCRFIGREDLATDPRFQTDQARWDYRDILDPIVSEWVAKQTAEEVIAAAEKIPIPAGISNNLTEVASHPQVKALEMLTKVPAPDGSGDVVVTGIPLRMSGTPLKIQRSYPAIGQHNEEIYGGLLGYSPKDLAKLKEEGVI